MFNFDWSELALIAIVALVLIGPKDMPVAIRAVSEGIRKLRRMAGELQGHVDEMVREADLGDARDTFRDLRSMNLRSQVMRTIDGDGKLAATLREKPLGDLNLINRARPAGGSTITTTTVAAAAPAAATAAFIPPPIAAAPRPAPVPPSPAPAAAFIPPGIGRSPPAEA